MLPQYLLEAVVFGLYFHGIDDGAFDLDSCFLRRLLQLVSFVACECGSPLRQSKLVEESFWVLRRLEEVECTISGRVTRRLCTQLIEAQHLNRRAKALVPKEGNQRRRRDVALTADGERSDRSAAQNLVGVGLEVLKLPGEHERVERTECRRESATRLSGSP